MIEKTKKLKNGSMMFDDDAVDDVVDDVGSSRAMDLNLASLDDLFCDEEVRHVLALVALELNNGAKFF